MTYDELEEKAKNVLVQLEEIHMELEKIGSNLNRQDLCAQGLFDYLEGDDWHNFLDEYEHISNLLRRSIELNEKYEDFF